MNTFFITNKPDIALHAEACGVSAIFVDMESHGKDVRQGHLDSHKAVHSLHDVEAVARVLTRAELMVRINPSWKGTPNEVADAISAGATRLMLPMFSHVEEVEQFKEAAGNVPVTLLAETAAALARLPLILPLLDPEDRVHFGLNDLSLEMKLGFLFEVLAGRLLDGSASLCRESDIDFGFGGVGRVGQGELPADWILGEHARLGSDWVILSRAFHGRASSLAELKLHCDLAAEIKAIQDVTSNWRSATADDLLSNHQRLARKSLQISGEIA